MRARGFTLIELLIAVLIMAVMAGLAWRGIDAVTSGREAAQQRVDAAARLALTLRQLDADLASAADAGAAFPAVSLAGNGDLLIVRHAAPALRGDPDEASALLEVARWGRRGSTWRRWCGPPTGDPAALAGQMQSAHGAGVAMLEPIGAVTFLVYRRAGIGPQQQSGAWVNPYTSAAVDAKDPLASLLRTPAGLRLTLSSGIPGLRGTIEREFLLENRQ